MPTDFGFTFSVRNLPNRRAMSNTGTCVGKE